MCTNSNSFALSKRNAKNCSNIRSFKYIRKFSQKQLGVHETNFAL